MDCCPILRPSERYEQYEHNHLSWFVSINAKFIYTGNIGTIVAIVLILLIVIIAIILIALNRK